MNIPNKLATGEFLTLAEMEPPKGIDVSTMVANATRVKGKVATLLLFLRCFKNVSF